MCGGTVATDNLISALPSCEVITIDTTSRFYLLKTLFEVLKKYNFHSHQLVILDGLLSYIFALLPYKKNIITVHHNAEFVRFTGIKKLITFYLQCLACKFSKVSIFFSHLDKNLFPESNSVVVLPLTKTNQNSHENIKPEKNYDKFDYIIPSNLSYGPNIDGLEKFYNYYRKRFNGRIIVTTPELSPDLEIHNWNNSDSIKTVKYSDYIWLLKNKKVILPIFCGSGIQMKALDALTHGTKVYATNFICRSNIQFNKFEIFDEEITFDSYDDYFTDLLCSKKQFRST